MTSEAKTIKIQILEEEYSLLSDEAQDLIINAGKHVDSLMKSIIEQTRLNDHKKVAILAALQIASELLKVKEELQQTEQKGMGLIEELDQQLSSHAL